MNNILITGGAGFVGRNFIDLLSSNYGKIYIIDNFSLGLRESFTSDKIKIIEFDLKNEFTIFDEIDCEELDEIWHFAANSDIPSGIKNINVDFENTFLTTLNTIKIAKKYKVKKFNFASSSAVYGDWNIALKESLGPLKPISNYGSMKLASEAILCSFGFKEEVDINIFRFPNVVGVPATHGVILDFFKKIKINGFLDVLGNGTQKKSYLHVKELINAMNFINNKSNDNINIINIGNNDNGITVKEIAELVVKKYDNEIKINYGENNYGWIGDVPRFKFNTDKLNNLGWRPKLSSYDSVELAINEIFNSLNL